MPGILKKNMLSVHKNYLVPIFSYSYHHLIHVMLRDEVAQLFKSSFVMSTSIPHMGTKMFLISFSPTCRDNVGIC